MQILPKPGGKSALRSVVITLRLTAWARDDDAELWI
jgi:hypothetical protein